MRLPYPLLAVAERSINVWIGNSYAALDECRALAGHELAVEITDLGLTVGLQFHDEGLSLAPDALDPAARFRGTAAGLMRAARRQRGKAYSTEIEMSGDTELARSLLRLFDSLDADPAELVAAAMGDLAAWPVTRMASGSWRLLRRNSSVLARDFAEYLTEELDWLARAEEIEAYARAVDTLADDLARAEARLRRLEGRQG
jgi:ubiquinone biosynthesis protein UbiJ